MFVIAVLCAVGTLLLGYIAVFESPPAFVAYGFGILNGASVVGLIATWLIRRSDDDD